MSSWSLPSLSHPTTEISSTVPNTLGKSLNISSIFLWNRSPAGTAPNGYLLHLYLPNQHTNVVRYDDLWSNIMLWYHELATIRERYCVLFNFGNISLNVGCLWTGLINAWVSFSGSRHNLTYPFGFVTDTKVLHHSTVSSMPSGAMMSCCCSHSNSSLNGLCGGYAMHLRLSGMACYQVWPVVKMYH